MAVGGENTVGYGALNSSDENGIQRREHAGAIINWPARRLMCHSQPANADVMST